MRSTHRFLPSPSMAVALVALVFSMGGGAIAATGGLHSAKPHKKPPSEAGRDAKQFKSYLAHHAVPHAKRADTALAAALATHALSTDNATHASSADAASSPRTLASGQTETGEAYVFGNNVGVAGFVGTSISFPFALASAPTGNYRPLGSAATPACPGSATNPTAASGNLCFYEITTNGTGQGLQNVTRFGAGVFAGTPASAGSTFDIGVWAVTG